AKNAQMTVRTLLTILQTRGVIPDSVDLDDETDELDAAARSQNDLEATAAAQARTLAISAALAGAGGAAGNADPSAVGTKGGKARKGAKAGKKPGGKSTPPAPAADPGV